MKMISPFDLKSHEGKTFPATATSPQYFVIDEMCMMNDDLRSKIEGARKFSDKELQAFNIFRSVFFPESNDFDEVRISCMDTIASLMLKLTGTNMRELSDQVGMNHTLKEKLYVFLDDEENIIEQVRAENHDEALRRALNKEGKISWGTNYYSESVD